MAPDLLGDEQQVGHHLLRRRRELRAQLRAAGSRCRPGRCRGGTSAPSGSPRRSGARCRTRPRRRRAAPPTTTSRPVLMPPSARSRTRPRSPLATSVCCVSARPSSHGTPGVLDRRERARAGAAVGAGDVDDVGERLHDAGRDEPDARLGDELHRDTSASGVHLPEVEDELREVLDRVDVVVRRRRDQRHARLGVPQPRDLGRDLVAGELAALARLRALRDLDLQLLREDRVLGRDAEAARTRPA